MGSTVTLLISVFSIVVLIKVVLILVRKMENRVVFLDRSVSAVPMVSYGYGVLAPIILRRNLHNLVFVISVYFSDWLVEDRVFSGGAVLANFFFDYTFMVISPLVAAIYILNYQRIKSIKSETKRTFTCFFRNIMQK